VEGREIGALAVTEEISGSSLAGMATVARATETGYVISGSKMYVSNGPIADVFLLIAAENPKRGLLGLTAFLVPRDTPGLSVRPLATTLGLKGAPMARVSLDDCVLPQEAVLGKPGGGFAVMRFSMQWERTCILAGFLGAAERDLCAAVEFARGRRDQRGTLFEHQAVSHRLAGLRCRLESARWMLYRGAWAVAHDKDPHLWPAMVKLTVSETVVEIAIEIMRTFAGAGWLDEKGVATALRDVVGTLSASGTSDVLLNIIAECLRSKP
jgi:alkylation response protein AidB-like acyl-CoA dehydrogenase